MRHTIQTLITTNGVDIVNPAIVARFSKNRVMGTLVYPNALAGIILLLFPVSLASSTLSIAQRDITSARSGSGHPPLTLALGLAAFFGRSSKLGWLLAMASGGLCLFRLNGPLKLKITALLIVAALPG